MKERPILMSAPMVRAILDGSKTQTRRIIKPRHKDGVICGAAGEVGHAIESWGGGQWSSVIHSECLPCLYGSAANYIWVKETWRPVGPWECREDGATVQYRADKAYVRKERWPESFRVKAGDGRDKWKPSIFMGRWASRITLEIISVRVERLQEISEGDSHAEGVDFNAIGNYEDSERMKAGYPFLNYCSPAKMRYAQLWESINGTGSWVQNPWVWVLEFKKL